MNRWDIVAVRIWTSLFGLRLASYFRWRLLCSFGHLLFVSIWWFFSFSGRLAAVRKEVAQEMGFLAAAPPSAALSALRSSVGFSTTTSIFYCKPLPSQFMFTSTFFICFFVKVINQRTRWSHFCLYDHCGSSNTSWAPVLAQAIPQSAKSFCFPCSRPSPQSSESFLQPPLNLLDNLFGWPQ